MFRHVSAVTLTLLAWAVTLTLLACSGPLATAYAQHDGSAPYADPMFALQMTTPSRADHPRARRLRTEIAELRGEKDAISQTGPVLMMIFGYVFAPLILAGPVLIAVGETCDLGNCTDLTTPGLVLTGLGVAGTVVGLAGLVIAMNRSDRRNALDGQIQDRQRELDNLALDLQFGVSQGVATLRITTVF